jgi:hypothetical protein
MMPRKNEKDSMERSTPWMKEPQRQVLARSLNASRRARCPRCSLSSFGELERTRNMMMIPVQVIAFFMAVMLILADVREFTIELQGKRRT